MIKIALFPYHPDIELLVKHKEWLADYEVVGIISYIEDGVLLKPLYEELGIKDVSVDDVLSCCDQIILLPNYRGYSVEPYYKIIEEAIKRDVEILITPTTVKELDLDEYRETYRVLEKPLPYKLFEPEIYRQRRIMGETLLCDIDVPVISIMGMGKNCGKFELLMLAKEALAEDYNIIILSANALGALCGCYTLPVFLYQDRSLEYKIFEFNYYLRQIVDKNSVDAILIEIPEGSAPFERNETNHFGEYVYIMTSATQIDMMLLSVYFFGEEVNSNSLAKLAEPIQNRFGVPVTGVAMSKTMFEITPEEENIIYENLSDEYIAKYYPHIEDCDGVISIDLTDYDKAKMKIKKCISVLERNAMVL